MKNSLVFRVAVALFALQSVCAIRCHLCEPSFGTAFSGNATNPVVSNSSLCLSANTSTIDCSHMGFDSCGTISVSMDYPIVGNISTYFLNCSVKSSCQQVGSTNCGGLAMLATTLNSTGSGIHIQSCQVTCCDSNLCNNPLVPATSQPIPTLTTTSSAKYICAPSNGAISGFLGLVPVLFMGVF